MLTVADVKCLHCGHVSGEMIAVDGQPVAKGKYRPMAHCADLRPGERLRCCRCGGPVFLDDVRTVRPLTALSIIDMHPKRGRPRKSEVMARAG